MRIVVDTSALIAVVLGEPDAERYTDALDRHAGDVVISAGTLLETRVVAAGRAGAAAVQRVQRLLDTAGSRIIDVNQLQCDLAFTAWQRYGKGRHPAGLNYGDLFSYALSKHMDAPLLFKGDDFPQTDVAAVL